MPKPLNTVVKYSLYAMVVILYLSLLQILLVNQVINSELFMVLMVPLIVAAYYFNRGKFEPKKNVLIHQTILSERESEVAAEVAKGMGNRQIAEHLFISENTVKTHIKNTLSKLELKNRTQIAQWYYENTHHPKG